MVCIQNLLRVQSIAHTDDIYKKILVNMLNNYIVALCDSEASDENHQIIFRHLYIMQQSRLSLPGRLATAAGSRNRPTVVIATDFDVWLGNEGSNEIVIKNMDVFGFHSGDFEVKPVTGTLSIWINHHFNSLLH